MTAALGALLARAAVFFPPAIPNCVHLIASVVVSVASSSIAPEAVRVRGLELAALGLCRIRVSNRLTLIPNG